VRVDSVGALKCLSILAARVEPQSCTVIELDRIRCDLDRRIAAQRTFCCAATAHPCAVAAKPADADAVGVTDISKAAGCGRRCPHQHASGLSSTQFAYRYQHRENNQGKAHGTIPGSSKSYSCLRRGKTSMPLDRSPTAGKSGWWVQGCRLARNRWSRRETYAASRGAGEASYRLEASATRRSTGLRLSRGPIRLGVAAHRNSENGALLH